MTLPIKELQLKSTSNILMELRKLCQHPYLPVPQLEDMTLPDEEQQKRLIQGSGKLVFLKLLLPKLKERGHRVLLFSQFKMALDRSMSDASFLSFMPARPDIEDFLIGDGVKYLRLDGDVQQATRQKSMDAFNAPGSDYFVFLLTTRAGGVGINLATADTVIVFDPDFNPHQDLQAIARSHRYGQTKPVLVFKLMTKDSVEEQIVYKGKKKMVLDHLVVQNLHATESDVDIDSIIMHGAKALYERDANADTGIVYTSKNVDEMIDQVERQAEEEARVLDVKWKEEDEAKARGETKDVSREARAFGFAKIWEADTGGDGRLKDADEEEADADAIEDDLAGARYVLAGRERAIAEQSALSRGERLRQKRKSDTGGRDFTSDDFDVEELDLTPVKKKGRGKGKGKGKEAKDGEAEASSDGEFAVPVGRLSDSESDASAGEQEAMLDDLGRPVIIGGIVADRHGAGKAALRAAKKAARASATAAPGIPPTGTASAAGAPASGSASGSLSPSKDYSMPRKKRREGEETAEARRLRKLQGKLDQHKARLSLMNANGAIQYAAATAAARNPKAVLAIPPPGGFGPSTAGGNANAVAGPSKPGSIVAAALAKEGSDTLQWLFHVLNNTGMIQELQTWAKLAHHAIDPLERKRYYDYLAKVADERLARTSHASFFTREKATRAVHHVIASKTPVLPPLPTVADLSAAMLPYPPTVGPVPIISHAPEGFTIGAAYANGGSSATSAGPVATIAAGSNGVYGQNSMFYGPAYGPSNTVRLPTADQSLAKPSAIGVPPNTQFVPTAPPRLPQQSSENHLNGVARASPAPIMRPAPARTLDLSRPNGTVNATKSSSQPTPPVTPIPTPFDIAPPSSTDGRAPVHPPAPPSSSRPASIAPVHPEVRCPVCEQVGHAFLECKQRIKVEDLQKLRTAAAALAADHANKGILLQTIDKQIQLYRDAGYAVPGSDAYGAVTGHTAANSLQAPASASAVTPSRQRTGSTQAEAILIDDNEIGPSSSTPTTTETQTQHAHLANHPSPAKRGRPPHVVICPICHGTRPHIAAQCPVVLAGSRSIKVAMENFAPSEPLFTVLKNLHKQHMAAEAQAASQIQAGANGSAPAAAMTDDAKCAFCLDHCGLAVRQCVEARGGRRALKEMIRKLNEGQSDDADEQARLDALFACYQAWPKT